MCVRHRARQAAPVRIPSGKPLSNGLTDPLSGNLFLESFREVLGSFAQNAPGSLLGRADELEGADVLAAALFAGHHGFDNAVDRGRGEEVDREPASERAFSVVLGAKLQRVFGMSERIEDRSRY